MKQEMPLQNIDHPNLFLIQPLIKKVNCFYLHFPIFC